MRNTLVAILFCLANNLFAQPYNADSIEQEFGSKRDDKEIDSIFENLFLRYAWYKEDSALFYTQKEIMLAKKLNSSLLESRALSRYGYILGLLGDYPQGIEYLLRALKNSEAAKDIKGVEDAYAWLSEIYLDQGDFKQAIFYTCL